MTEFAEASRSSWENSWASNVGAHSAVRRADLASLSRALRMRACVRAEALFGGIAADEPIRADQLPGVIAGVAWGMAEAAA